MAARRRSPALHLAVTSRGAQVGYDDSRRVRDWAIRILEAGPPSGSWVIFLHRGIGARTYFTRPYATLVREGRAIRVGPLEGHDIFVVGRGLVHVPLTERALAAIRLTDEAARLDARGAEAREVISDLLREEGYDELAAELDEVSGRTGTTPFALNPRSFLHLRRHARARELVERLPGLYAAVRYALSRME